MTTHAQTSESLTAQSTQDTTTANTLHAESTEASIQAKELQDEASVLQMQAKEDETQSIKDTTDAHSFRGKVDEEMTEVKALEAKVASEEALYESEFEKASTEGSAATSSAVKVESDGAGTALCEIIPFLDIICDFVGGIAAVGFESNAAKLSAQSAIDYTSAATTKAQEDADVAALDTLRTEIGEDSGIATGYTTKAKEEEIKSQKEEAQAEEELKEAAEKEAESKEEQIESEEEVAKANEEEAEAEEEMDKSLIDGLKALKDAVLSGIFSTLVVLFFSIRILIAVIIPGAASVIGFIPYTMSLPTAQYGAVASSSALSRTNVYYAFMNNFWLALPRRETSYFVLHCGVFISTMSIWFCSKFQKLDDFDIRSKGGIVIAFAAVASCVQGFLLHSIPHLQMTKTC